MTGLRDRLRSIAHAVGATRDHVIEAQAQIAAVDARLNGILRSISDREPWQRERLHELRASDEYEAPFTESEPLVSVVIPTYDNHVLLRERAIPSILEQTYQRFEVIVVGDAATEEARAAVEGFGDARLRYSNLAHRGPYPSDPLARWHVAGVPPYNEAVRLANGHWIAPADDDDSFRPEHLEQLLEKVRRERLELVYSKILQQLPTGSCEILGRFPPEQEHFGLQSALYHGGLAGIFQLELTDWLFDLPYDWGLCQRMLRAGVQMGMLDEVSVEYFPSRAWAPRDGTSLAPEWELVPEGWDLARRDDQDSSRGWDVEEVALAYAKHWPAFCDAISAPRPLGVWHELTPGAQMTNTSIVAHNTALTLSYVLARIAPTDGAVSVLDWGGGVGHQHAIARSALPEMQFEWHTRELPAVCREGRRASPSIIFHETEECLERKYDFVLASGSFQYAEDWRALLARLAGAARGKLLITRLPLVDFQPSFVVIQRAQAYGYATEYLGWVFNRAELLDGATAAGLELEREFFLQEPMEVAGAPESPTHGAFLFKPPAA